MLPEYVPNTLTIKANCPNCNGVLTTFLGNQQTGSPIGQFIVSEPHQLENKTYTHVHYMLFRCSGCNRGGLAEIYSDGGNPANGILKTFHPVSVERAQIPPAVPDYIATELREAEICASIGAWRASSALLRSTLEKILKANGYSSKDVRSLEQKIDAAHSDGILTDARRKRAHSDVRVLGNDVLHDKWREISPDEVQSAHHYTQRILEDFYDDRPSVETILKDKNRSFTDEPIPADEQIGESETG